MVSNLKKRALIEFYSEKVFKVARLSIYTCIAIQLSRFVSIRDEDPSLQIVNAVQSNGERTTEYFSFYFDKIILHAVRKISTQCT